MNTARRSRLHAWGIRLDELLVSIRIRFAGTGGIDREFAAALRSLAASVRAGRSLAVAFDDASHRVDGCIAAACARCAARFRLGIAHSEVLSALHQDIGLDTSRLLVDVLIVRHRAGGDLGDVCHRVARLVDERTRLRVEARSATAQARFTAQAVLILPALLLVVWWQLAPETLRQLTSGGGLLILSPAIVLLLTGIVVIRRIATSAMALAGDGATRRHASSLSGRAAAVIAGTGPLSIQSLRLVIVAALPCIAITATSSVPVARLAAAALVVCAAIWPWAQTRAATRHARDVVDSGIDTLLEVSIGLLAAGAPPRAVATGAIAACPGSLGRELSSRAAQIELGRSVESALASSASVRTSPELDAWVHALTRDARHGAAATDTLERLLADVRTRQREQLRARAATAGPRMQLATVLLVVPAILWFVLVATGLSLVRQLQSTGMLG